MHFRNSVLRSRFVATCLVSSCLIGSSSARPFQTSVLENSEQREIPTVSPSSATSATEVNDDSATITSEPDVETKKQPTDNEFLASFFERNGPQFDVLDGAIDNNRISRAFLGRAQQLVDIDEVLDVEQVDDLLKAAPRRSSIPLPTANPSQNGSLLDDDSEVYRRMVAASLLVGVAYDCGRCSNLHTNIAGGVFVSPDGLVLTNHHVVSRNTEGNRKISVMTSDGRAFPITEVLATSKKDDVALIRVAVDKPVDWAPIAQSNPRPMEKIRILSHPQEQYFVLTEGKVSRIATLRSRSGSSEWMEVTADFAGGSSGSGVFNERGEIVGLVSRIYPLFREANSRGRNAEDDSATEPSRYPEMILKRCVPATALLECFAKP